MRICLVHEEYPAETNFGGIATYQKRLAEEYVKQGHKVYVIARALKNNQHYIENGVDITRIYVKSTNNQINDYIEYRNQVASKLKALQDENLIDIIEVPDWGAETVMFESYRKVPLVVRLHTPLKVWLQFNKNNFGEITDLMLKWEDRMLKSANLITCCSSILKKMIVESFKIPAKDILVTPNPADLNYFFKDESISKQERILYVGSLEERKGVCVLARALNIFLKTHPNVQVDFIGKDTNRNNKNISTIEYIKQIINPEFHNNIHFLGQKNNCDLNPFYNRSRVAVFPSLFDNFPYVTLEAMATGVQIVGSKNSGMIEMLADGCVYDTPDYNDLAKLITLKYEESFSTPYNEKNIKKVNNQFNSKVVCENMIKYYEQTISEYKNYFIPQSDFEQVLTLGGIVENITGISRIHSGVSNAVFKVKTTKNTYIIKKYNCTVNFDIAKELYSQYSKIGVHCVTPINSIPITYNNNVFNIFEYIKGKKLKDNFVEKLKCLVLLDRKCKKENIIKPKVNFYYEKLIENTSKDIQTQTKYVINEYEKIKNNFILTEQFTNHGDISKSNVFVCNNHLTIIDFDEVTIAPMLYDFAVISIKFFMDKYNFDMNTYQEFENEIIEHSKYNQTDCRLMIKFYLCKILLEKFYLHSAKKINVFSKEQKRDNFNYYYKLLQKF